MREFLGALMRNCGNDPAFGDRLSAEFRQETDQNRLGRLIVLRFPIELPVTDEPWIALPFKTSTGSSTGVSILVDVAMSFTDGTSVDQGVVVIP